MCKIIAISNAAKININDKFLNTVKTLVTPNEKDGFGYSVQGEKGHYGEKTVDVNSRFVSRHGKPDYLSRYKSMYTETHQTFGVQSKTIGSFIGHGRFSTNNKGVHCAHPYTNGKYSLIHNGVVKDIGHEKIKTVTGNDTEIIFEYWKRGGLTDVSKNVAGYYALAIQESETLLHVVKDDTARLCMSYSPVIDSLVFATTKDILEGMDKAFKWKLSPAEIVKDNIHIILKGNKVEMQSSFVPAEEECNFDKAMLSHSLDRSDLYNDSFGYSETIDDEVKDDLVNDIINMETFKMGRR